MDHERETDPQKVLSLSSAACGRNTINSHQRAPSAKSKPGGEEISSARAKPENSTCSGGIHSAVFCAFVGENTRRFSRAVFNFLTRFTQGAGYVCIGLRDENVL